MAFIIPQHIKHHHQIIIHLKKPKTASEWATTRKSYRSTNMTHKKQFNTTYISNTSKPNLDWEQKIQFEALCYGNKNKQHDILRSNLNGTS